nr:reverse transcriptase domain-containing protein [Tanacetum cinerariifolium]
MSAMANTTPLVTTVTKPATNPRDANATLRVNIQEFCEEYYEDILPIIMDKVRHDRRKDIHTRLDFREGPRERTREDSHHSSARARTTRPEWLKVQDHLRYGDRHVLDRLGHRRHSAFDRLSETYLPSTTKSRPRGTGSRDHPRGRSRPRSLDTSKEDYPQVRERIRGVGESYDDSFSHSYRDGNRSRHMKRRRDNESPLSSVSRSDSSDERVWFNELPPESIDSYKDLKAAFLAYFMQQKKYVKDPVKIHNIKQKDGETIEDFMKRFKVETGRMKGAPESMRISRFMHGVNNPELIKRLNEHVPKTMEEMMITTTAFIRGEAAAASKKKGHASWKAQDQSKRQNSDKRSDFQGHSREGRGSNQFTPLIRTPKEILAAEAGKFQMPPPMIEELVRVGKLSHLIKEIKQGRDQSKTGKKETTAKDKPTEIYMVQSWQRTTRQKVTQSFERVKEITFPPLPASSGTEGPLVIEAKMDGHMIHRISRRRAAHEVPLLTVTANRVIKIEDPATATDSSGVPSTIEWSLLDFAHEDPSQQLPAPEDQKATVPEVPPLENVTTTAVASKAGQAERVAATSPPVVKERRKRGHDGVDTNAPPKVPRRYYADPQPTESNRGGKSLAAIELGMGSTRPTPASQGVPVDVSDPDPLSFAGPQSCPFADAIQSSKGAARARDPDSRIYHLPPWSDLLRAYTGLNGRIEARENEIKNLETLLEAETDMKKAVENKSAELNKELENMRALFSDLQVSNKRLSQQVSTLHEQVIGEEKLKAAFEEFKQYEDNRVEQRCAEMDVRLDALSIDFDEELYPHMLTTIAGHRWMIGRVATSFSFMNLSLTTSTSTCLDKCAKLVDAILLRASTFLFLLRGTWLIENVVNPLTKLLTISSGKDFFADLERNLFRLANFPLRLWTSLIVRGDDSCSTTAVLSGHGFIPSGVTTYPKNTPSVNPNAHFLGLSFMLTCVMCEMFPRYLSSFQPLCEYPSQMLSRCSATDCNTPVISDGCHANISNFFFRMEHNSVRPLSDNIPPIATS